jgi:2-polyprenyl-3-methyl-5-hydroxy-6-metoxy-1,4-benzoquinol methylase
LPQFNSGEYWEQRLREHYTLAGVGYLRLGRRYNEWMYRVRGEVFDRVAREIADGGWGSGSQGHRGWQGAEVLDVGAGTGFYMERWIRFGAQVVGMDLTAAAMDGLSQRFPGARLVQADIGGSLEGVAVRLGSFHAVSAFDVLFHIVDDAAYARAFTNIASLLRPGGWFLWSDNFVSRPAKPIRHQAFRPIAASTRLVETAGFEILGRVPMFVTMNYPADTRSRLARWAWTAMVSPALLAEPLGWLLGALLYPIERRLVRRVADSPSTELMVCRKR